MDPSAVGRIAEEVIMICETNGGRPTLKADLRAVEARPSFRGFSVMRYCMGAPPFVTHHYALER